MAAVWAVAATTAVAAPAAAHVDVLPRTAPQGEAVELVVRVPNERSAATVEVRVAFPPQVTVYSIGAAPAGWRVLLQPGADRRLAGVRYVGGRIRTNRYADFPFLATPFEAGTAVFRTEQVHADGVVSRFTGAPEREGDTGADGSGAAEPAAGEVGPAPALEIAAEGAEVTADAGDGDGSSGAGVWLGVIAIAIAAGAAVATGLLWSTRPARLPDDDEGAA